MWIRELVWTPWNREHIARHGVEPEEVEELVASRRFYSRRIRGRRYCLIRQTDAGRYLSVIVDRKWDSDFYVVTARPADPDERRLFLRHVDPR